MQQLIILAVETELLFQLNFLMNGDNPSAAYAAK